MPEKTAHQKPLPLLHRYQQFFHTPVELPPAPLALGKTPPAAPPKPKMNLSESTRKSLEKTKLDIISANELENTAPCPCQSGKMWGECHSPTTKP